MSARTVAAGVLVRVWSEGAYAAAALSSELSRSGLDSRDRGLATELTYGVLRTQGFLERRLAEFGKVKPSDKVQLSHLLVAAYQLEFLDRIPPRAAVHEAVQSVTELRGARVGGFCNAILRRVADLPPDRRITVREAALSCAPSWLRKRLSRDVGLEGAEALLAPSMNFAPTLRVVGDPDPDLTSWLQETCSRCENVPRAFRFEAGGDPRNHPSFEAGGFVVQELGAQMVTHALGAQPGERILDTCAGRGQKTSLLAELVGAGGQVVATDLHDHKIRALGDEMARLGARVEARIWDLTSEPPAEFVGAFDRVLVDAPCSGVGTLNRRPEIARRLDPDDPGRMGALQALIVRNASLALRPGGVLLYATCSVLREEAEAPLEVAFGAGGGPSTLRPRVLETGVDGALFPGGRSRVSATRLLPHVHGTDGYFLARLHRE